MVARFWRYENREVCISVWLFGGEGDEPDMSRLSFRPRPLDIHKKLPIVKSVKEFEDDEAPVTGASTRNSQLLRLAAETEIEVMLVLC